MKFTAVFSTINSCNNTFIVKEITSIHVMSLVCNYLIREKKIDIRQYYDIASIINAQQKPIMYQ